MLIPILSVSIILRVIWGGAGVPVHTVMINSHHRELQGANGSFTATSGMRKAVHKAVPTMHLRKEI